MARYFLHLRNGTEEVLDELGGEYPALEAVRQHVRVSALDLIVGDIRTKGVLDLRFRIDAENEGGQVVYSLPFQDAIKIIPKDG